MKRFLKVLSGVMAVACLTAALAACGDEPSTQQPVVTLDLRDGSAPQQISVAHGDLVMKNSPFKIPKREGWFFDSWYLDENCTQSAINARILEDTKIYAGWTDTTVVPMNQTAFSVPYEDLFDISIRAVPGGWENTAKLYITVTPKGDFTGKNSTDRFEIQVTHNWLSNEQFLGEYTNEVTAYACAREIYLEKSNNYTLTDYEVTTGGTTIPDYVFNENRRTSAKIDYIYGDPTLQYNHNN